MKNIFNSKINTKIIIVVIVVLFSLAISVLFTNNRSKYDRAAIRAAKATLSNEVGTYRYTSVKTGRLNHMHTFYNENINTYRVSYYAKFVPADEEVDEWVEISVDLSSTSLKVRSTSLSYLDVDYYENEILPQKYKNYTGQEDKDGKWIKVD